MTKEKARELLEIYGRAWETKNPELIVTIFTPNATYNDPAEPENTGHEGIRDYWVKKVIEGQRDIHFELLNVWVDGDAVIAEWNADFVDIKRNIKIDMREFAIFTAEGDKFGSLREYYETVKTPL